MCRVLGLTGNIASPEITPKRRELARTAGITDEQLLALIARGCPLCLRPFEFERLKRPVAFDHNHALGDLSPASFRGLLCPGCNTLLGRFKRASDDEVRDWTNRALRFRVGSLTEITP